MCDNTCCCQQQLRGDAKPEDCSPEQIRACHGENADHPCVASDDEQDDA